MGFRTVPLLINDQMHEWSRDPNLGQLIKISASSFSANSDRRIGNYGYVLECVHADTQTLAVIDSYHMDVLATGQWGGHDMQKIRDLTLLKRAAEKLGYKLVKA